ncbi:uncharacterized protein NPIL_663931 [Nephila pilipes]|uniref:Uncharacterized protein n=1 Tax=Nephila pilipes TaxID=299642 RepID=A0A8X6NZ29_NEPPI|nr:uncharacterized protein NPIL_663931 [Nephila pilipes]
MFSPGRELFSFSKEPIFRLTARLVERHAFALRARYGCHGNTPPLHFTSGLLRCRFFLRLLKAMPSTSSKRHFGRLRFRRRLSTNLYFNRARSFALCAGA